MRFTTTTLLALCPFVAFATTLTAQDDCSTAPVIVAGANGPFSNVGMTASVPGASCAAASFDRDIWLLYPATCTGMTTIESCATASGDTVMEVYDGTGGCGALVSLGCNDDSCGLQSSVTFAAVSGTLYYVRVDTFGTTATQTAWTITVNTPCAPQVPGDECATALGPLVLGSNPGLSNVGMTVSAPGFPCSFNAAPVKDVWYTFVAGCTAPHTFSTCSGALNDTVLEVLDSCANLQSLGCNDDSCGLRSEVTVNLVVNNTYLVRCGGWNSSVGSFAIDIATGTNTGTIVAGGGGTTSCAFGLGLITSGNPNIGNSITATIGGVEGGLAIPVILYNFPPVLNVNLLGACNCTILDSTAPGGFFLFSNQQVFPIPCNPLLIGLQADIQGGEFFRSITGCSAAFPLGVLDLWALTDIDRVTIG